MAFPSPLRRLSPLLLAAVVAFASSAQGQTTPASKVIGSPPKILLGGRPTQIVLVGQPAFFDVLATGSSPIKYQWQLNGVNIRSATSARYEIASAVAADAGNYTVLVKNPFGNVTANGGNLTVWGPPIITCQPTAATATAGYAAIFIVAATNATTCQWLQNGVPPSADNVSGANTSTLFIANVTAANAGNYSAVVTNTWGNTTSNSVKLTVKQGATQFATDPISTGCEILLTPPKRHPSPTDTTPCLLTLNFASSGYRVRYENSQSTNGIINVNISYTKIPDKSGAATPQTVQFVFKNPGGGFFTVTANGHLLGPPQYTTSQDNGGGTVTTLGGVDISGF